jgi:hypothetical protein
MRTLHVEQAIFASSDRGSIKGYQLVARSAGVDRAVCQALCRWAPTQIPSDDPADWMINYFPINDKLVAVTRTVLGGPEYSGRGGIQVVTLILLLREDQFHAYSCNPILVAKTALSMGLLRLPIDSDCEQLPVASLPSQPLVEPPSSAKYALDSPSQEKEAESALLDQVADLIRHARRVAVIGIKDPISAAERLIPKLAVDTRRSFSFTTGLTPTVRRPFQAHFLATADLTRRRTLDAQNITCIELRR